MMRKFVTALFIVSLLAGSVMAAEAPKVVARVNSQDITEAEVFEYLQPFGQQAFLMYATPQGKKMIIDDVISLRLFALEGERASLDQTHEFQQQLARARRAMLAQAAMRKVIEGLTVSDDEAVKFYNDNPQFFTQPEKIRASHILVSSDEALAKVKAELAAGKSFDVVAREYSTDPGSAAKGGDLGEFPRGVMVAEFEKAAFDLKNPGDVSEPVKSKFGWHIIKLAARIPESKTPFEQVKPRIIQELREQKTQKLINDRSAELEKVYKVERF